MAEKNLNLLTQEEKTEQFKTRAVRVSSVASIFLLIAAAGVSGYFFFQVSNIKSELKTKDQQITRARSDISSMEDIEIVARSLYKKYLVLETIFGERIYHSELFSDFNSKIPEGVRVDSFKFNRDNTVEINGAASNYLLVSDFLVNFNESDEDESERIFTEAYLRSVELDTGSSSVEYSMVISYNPEVLKNGLK